MLRRASLFLPTLLLTGLAGADEIDYERDVHPILKDRCFACHGPEKQKGKLRLDTRDGLFAGDPDALAVVPGKPDESLLYELITLDHDDPDRMPEDGDPLTKEQIATLEQWIREGAQWTEVAPEEIPEGPDLSVPPISPEQQAGIDRARSGLAERGLLALPIAADLAALDVNFSLQRDKAGDAEVGLLAGLEPCLVWLNLSGTAVTDAGLAGVGRHAELRRLNLSNTKVTDAGLAHLAGLGKLTYLNLYGTGITDAGLAHLAGLAQLEKLYLWQTQVTDAGVAALQERLPKLAVNRGAALAAITPRAPGPINAKCPVSGTDVDKAVVSVVDAQAIGFCCTKCKAKFDADPKAFLAKVTEFQPGPVNAKCPVSGADVDTAVTSEVEGQLVAFCCTKCKAAFDKDPKAFLAKLPELKQGGAAQAPINAKCPVSGADVDAAVTSEVEGQLVAFCCTKCKTAFDKDPKAFLAKLPELKKGEQAKGPANTKCPVSGQPVDVAHVSSFEGREIAFCCPKCKGAFDKDPAQFKDKVAAVLKQ